MAMIRTRTSVSRLAPEEHITNDFTSRILDRLQSTNQVAAGSFSNVYRCTVESSEGNMTVAVKVFTADAGRDRSSLTRAFLREVGVLLKLKHPNIVPLLGTARVESPLPALVSQWMSSGTLFNYLNNQASIITLSTRIGLVDGIAQGLNYLHSQSIVHGNLHPGNVLIDDSGSPCLVDFGLLAATEHQELQRIVHPEKVVHGNLHIKNVLIGNSGSPCHTDLDLAAPAERPGLQQTNTTAEDNLVSPWNAPEVLGVNGDSQKPSLKSDMYSFGGIVFFVISGDVPREKKNSAQILLEEPLVAAHLHIMPDHWKNLIMQCCSLDPERRPEASQTLKVIADQKDVASVPKNIVIFGETGAGKSSVINLMAKQDITKTSPDMERCTLHWNEHEISFDGHSYKVFDTVGLEEPELGAEEYVEILMNAYNLVTTLDKAGGIDLLVFCVRAGRVTATLQTNYRLFHEWLCDKKVPIVLVLTGLEREKRMDDWWERNKAVFQKYKIDVNGHACITAANKLDGRHKELYEESRLVVRKLVFKHTYARESAAFKGGEGSLIRIMWNLFGKTLSKRRRAQRKDATSILIKRCGLSPSVAKTLVGKLNDTMSQQKMQ